MSEAAAGAVAPIPDGYRMDAKGRLVPEHMIKPVEALEDQMVSKIMGHANELSAQIRRFRGHCFDDIGSFLAILSEKYQNERKRGGVKGNMTFTSYDGCLKVQVAVADTMSFGPELQVAKSLIDECIRDWSEEASEKVRLLVQHAFRVDKQGEVSREAIFALRRAEIEDDRWKRAMEAITDSIRITGSKSYIRFYTRPNPDAAWTAVTIDLASA